MNKNRNPVNDQFIEFLKFPIGMSEEKQKRTEEARKFIHNANHKATIVTPVIPTQENINKD